jgi:VanZ family protein
MSLVSSQIKPEQPVSRGVTLFGHLTLVALAVYWIAMFTGTHWPRVSMPGFSYSDKVLHYSAFFGLSILLCTFWAARAGAARVSLIVVLAALALYGLVDEISQIPVGRDCEVLDWCADMAGALTGVTLFSLVTWKARRTSAADQGLVVPRRVS